MRKMLLFCILVIGVLVLLSGCKPVEEVEEEVPEAEEEVPEVPEEVVMPTDIFSGLKCVDNTLEVTLYNIGEETIEIGKEITFIVNGLVTNPNFFECDPGVELESGASATCTITPVKPLRAENVVKISQKGAETAVEMVVCAAEEEEE